MKHSLTTVLIFFLLSCSDSKKENPEIGDHKLISIFRPAFDEASEITFLQNHSLSHLSILIRKNFRLDEKEDSFYYKTVALDEKQIAVIQNAVLWHFDFKP